MFTKRPDKYTTGFINMRNDCFANSSLQAYSALPGLTDYLNKFISSFNRIKQFVETNNIKMDDGGQDEDGTALKSRLESSNTRLDIPLHMSLAEIIKKLQETQMTSRTISVWTFLHSLEKIFNAKISRSQHDAHELTQLINEMLENENIMISRRLKKLKTEFQENMTFLKELELIELPEFPFSGLILSQMKCLSCQHISKPSFSPFLMLTLHTPEKLSTDLEAILNENESESIEGYQCLKCRLIKIVANEQYLKENDRSKYDENEDKIINKLIDLNNDEKLCINEDLQTDIEKYIKSYNKGGLDISKVTSTVFRKTQILKPPKIFGLHLSRSSFNGVSITRNSCRVSFKDSLTLSIGKEYHDELKQFQEAAQEESYIDSSNIKSSILTTDINDMEDEEVQREDVDEKGIEDDDEETVELSAATEGIDEQNAENESDALSLTSIDSVQSSYSSSDMIKSDLTISDKPSKSSDLASDITTIRVPDTLNNAPITVDQTDNLKKHFRKFKFNDNDIYKYKLRAIIRHIGSHTQGHYECYKRKPLYVKDREGTIFKLSPEIFDSVTGDTICDVSVTSKPSSINSLETNVQDTENSNGSSENANRRRKISSSLKSNDRPESETSLNFSEPHETVGASKHKSSSHNAHSIGDARGSKSAIEEEFKDSGSSHFRRKLSNMMGRRPSVFQADPEQANIHEIIHSGLVTPAELIVDDLEAGYFSPSLANAAIEKSVSNKPIDANNRDINRVKMKKIPSLIKNPFWRISDSHVAEVSRDSVLFETATVYMLYYERVDRKQIKRQK